MHATHWRLIYSPFADGPANMAVDEAILRAVANSASAPPTLRLYRWQPPCLSLGYAQSSADVDLPRLASLGWDLVRRPTGGRAILHTDELTYSVAAWLTEPRVQGGVVESYRRLSEGLLAGLRRLGVHATVQAEPSSAGGQLWGALKAVCFETPSHYEITAGGKKLLGSAQVRKRGVVLQHGSLPLAGDMARICDGLPFDTQAEREVAQAHVRSRATTVEAELGRQVSWEEAARAVATGFAEALNVELVEAELTAREIAEAASLRREKYGNEAWNSR